MKKTEDIIERLAADLRPVPAFALERRLAFAALPALGVSLLLMFIILGPRGDMRDAVSEPAFWVKSFYNALLAMVAFFAVRRLARPEGERSCLFVGIAVIVSAMAVMAFVQLGFALPEAYRRLILGSSALHCPLLIVAFSVPVFLRILPLSNDLLLPIPPWQVLLRDLRPERPEPGSIPGSAAKTAWPSC